MGYMCDLSILEYPLYDKCAVKKSMLSQSVTIIHRLTGMSVTCNEFPFQWKNEDVAFERLRKLIQVTYSLSGKLVPLRGYSHFMPIDDMPHLLYSVHNPYKAARLFASANEPLSAAALSAKHMGIPFYPTDENGNSSFQLILKAYKEEFFHVKLNDIQYGSLPNDTKNHECILISENSFNVLKKGIKPWYKA
jgi:hypothetical protein